MPRAVTIHPVLLSFIAFILLVLWMLSGFINTSAERNEQGPESVSSNPTLMKVQVSSSIARPVSRKIDIQGQLEPLRAVQLRAETEGRVTEIKAKKGQRVSQGDVILVLALNDRRAKLEEAEAKVRHLDARLEATRKLQTKGYADEVTIMEIEASLASARAELKDIEIDIAHTRITAPFDGIVNDRDMEEGDYVRVGDVVANIVDDNTLLASGYLPQQSIGKIRVGQPAKARVFTGEELEGTVTYISALSGNESRTYRVELEIPNPKHLLTAGVSTMITLSAGASEGHFISPSALSLGGEEQLGVKVVGNDNRVIFYPVEIVRTEMNGIWVSGLPSRINLITLGQGFVNAGEEVIPVTRVAAESTSATVTL